MPPAKQLFQDVGIDRERTFPFRLSEAEHEFLHEQAKKEGTHVAVVVRRALRAAFQEQPPKEAS